MTDIAGDASPTSPSEECRLCGGLSHQRFDRLVLQKYKARYFVCEVCNSMQTQRPDWLEEAYAENLTPLDTGAAQRNIYTFGLCRGISKVFNLRTMIDVGGGDGLLCRMMRDYGVDCHVSDRYAAPIYAQGFTDTKGIKPDFITSFEVLEHFVDPKTDIEDIFGRDASVVLVSTMLYKNQDMDWYYLVPLSGQHIFFYSEVAMRHIANRFGYNIITMGFSKIGDFTLFVKKGFGSPFQLRLARLAMRPDVSAFMRGMTLMRTPQGAAPDAELIRKRLTEPGG